MTSDQKEMAKVKMVPVDPPQDNPGNLPYITHAGEIRIGNETIRVYQLNTGQRIFDAEDINRLLSSFTLK